MTLPTPKEAGLLDILSRLREFRDERDWKQFHTPRQLGVALSVEVAELQELFLWKTDEQVSGELVNSGFAERLRHELADVLIYALMLAEAVGVDPEQAIREKIAVNALKYPVAKSRGTSKKSTELDVPSS